MSLHRKCYQLKAPADLLGYRRYPSLGTALCEAHQRGGYRWARRKRILSCCEHRLDLVSLLLTDMFQVNRNKKSLGLSFAHPAGVDILHRLVKECDVLVENYLPGSLSKYAMDFATLSKINPNLIYASITGYGQTGPYSNRAGYDVMVEA